MMRVLEQLAIFCGLGIPVFFRAAEIVWKLTKGEYDFRTKGRFNKHIHFWTCSPYVLILPGSAVMNLVSLIVGRRILWFENFVFLLALCVAVEAFFYAAFRLLNKLRSRRARQQRAKWRAATAPPLDLACPPEPDRAPRQGFPYNDRQIDFDCVYENGGFPVAWDEMECRLIRQDLAKAENYLKARPWFRDIRNFYYGTGIGGVFGVFLFRVETDSPEDDAFLWVVAGDVPATHLSGENARTPRQALRKYLDAMSGRRQGEAEKNAAVSKRLQLLENFLSQRRFG